MTLHGQRGQTLVELLVATAVTAVVLGALAGVLYTVSDRYSHWASRVDQAGSGAAVAASLQADSHRYLPCDADTGSLDLFSPLLGTVHYDALATAGGGYVVTRLAPGGGPAIWVERFPAQPTYTLQGDEILVSAPGTPGVAVFYRPQPWGCP